MSLQVIILILLWMIFVAFAAVVAMRILRKRGWDGMVFGAVTVFGAAGSGLALLADGPWAKVNIFAVAGVVLFLVGCLGLMPQRHKRGHCKGCGYDLRGETDDEGVLCPECGLARPGMESRCRSCKADIRNAIAGGTIKCPLCGAPVVRNRD